MSSCCWRSEGRRRRRLGGRPRRALRRASFYKGGIYPSIAWPARGSQSRELGGAAAIERAGGCVSPVCDPATQRSSQRLCFALGGKGLRLARPAARGLRQAAERETDTERRRGEMLTDRARAQEGKGVTRVCRCLIACGGCCRDGEGRDKGGSFRRAAGRRHDQRHMSCGPPPLSHHRQRGGTCDRHAAASFGRSGGHIRATRWLRLSYLVCARERRRPAPPALPGSVSGSPLAGEGCETAAPAAAARTRGGRASPKLQNPPPRELRLPAPCAPPWRRRARRRASAGLSLIHI